ncbi:MAG: hypothetical protein JO157_18335 [Acetobacteraceae bacterium]|nr:hypothetical protein [Acetobacteraceae bacterium]
MAGIALAASGMTLARIAAQLEAIAQRSVADRTTEPSPRERTPRGGTRWHLSSVRHLLLRAERRGLILGQSPLA